MSAVAIPTEFLKRFPIEEYHRLRDKGELGRHTELLDGVLIETMTISPRHRFILHTLRKQIESSLPDSFQVYQESPITIKDSEPEPDLSIVRGTGQDFKDSHPTTAFWVIEVAISSLALDLAKRKIYAQAGIEYYWILDPEQNRILAFSKPVGETYIEEKIFTKQELIAIPGHPDQSLNLDWIS